MGYTHNVILAFDQLANALCGGNPDNTISARVGYFAQVNQNASKYYWKTVESVIDFTYWPLDGPNHCRQAFEGDPEEIFNDNNSDFFRFFMTLLIIVVCIPVSILLYSAWAILWIFGVRRTKAKIN